MGRGSGHVWLGLRCPAKSLGRASPFCSQRLLSAPFSVPSTSQGAQLRTRFTGLPQVLTVVGTAVAP